jgi:SAM-dependent methyltransferase
MAVELGVVEWSLEVPNEEEVTAADRTSRGSAGQTYLFPSHPSEIDRLDVQHYALRETLGVNYLAPVGQPGSVLDVGCGTGQWGFELGEEFPEAAVVGLDLVPSKAGSPPNYRFVKANVLQGLPFASESFDFVHQRLMLASAVPVSSWGDLLADLARVMRPGGWIELVEGIAEIDSGGPATRRLTELTQRLRRSLGLDTTGIVVHSLDSQLRREGMVRVQRRDVQLPIGEWGGPVGALMASDFRAAYARLDTVFESRFDLTSEEYRGLIGTAQAELDEYQSTGVVVAAFGQKPG